MEEHHYTQEEFQKAIRVWFALQGDATFRLNYPLTSDSVILDVGGYHGDWTQAMLNRYHCRSYVFEPVPDFAGGIKKRFEEHPEVTIFEAGLGAETGKRQMEIEQDASSAYREVGNHLTIDIHYVGICDFLEILSSAGQKTHIDVIKINIEGGEYELLEKICAAGVASCFQSIQVQFHNIPQIHAEERMKRIWKELAKTHRLTWNFRPYVWEKRERRKDCAGV